MTIDVLSIPTQEQRTDPKDIVNGLGLTELHYLKGLRRASTSAVEAIIKEIEQDLGLTSEFNLKSDRAALDKAQRPAVLARYPWFTIAHIRDFLRFRTHLKTPDDFEAVLEVLLKLRSRGAIDIVKIDSVKLLRPGAFGWRMLATDLRITSSGMLVEHYMTFSELIRINQEWLHGVYEKWRDRSTDEMTVAEAARFYGDARFSGYSYRELFLEGLMTDTASTSTARSMRATATDDIMGSLKPLLSLP